VQKTAKILKAVIIQLKNIEKIDDEQSLEIFKEIIEVIIEDKKI
jgi:hypothetical protein